MNFWNKLFGNRETTKPAKASCGLVVSVGGTTMTFADREELRAVFLFKAIAGNREAIKALLKDGNDPGLVSVRGSTSHETPLHWAARNGHTDVVELLLAHNADVNAKDRTGDTPLQWAVEKGMNEVAELLRQHGGHE